MPKSISIYIPDSLAELMNEYSEVNWSEIGRIAIEDYLNGRRRFERLGEEMQKHLEEVDKLEGKLTRLLDYEQNVREDYTTQTQFTTGGEKIICTVTSLSYFIKESELCLMIALENDLDWDVVLDRITFELQVTARGQDLLMRKQGIYAKKEMLHHDTTGFGARIYFDLNQKEVELFENIAELQKTGNQEYYHTVEMWVYCDSRDGVLRSWNQKSDDIIFYDNRQAMWE